MVKKFDGKSDYISVPDSNDSDLFGSDDFTVDVWIKRSKWRRFKFKINMWYNKLITRNWYSILYKLGIVKGTYCEYLDIRSFKRRRYKSYIYLILAIAGIMLVTYLTDKFLGDYFLNINNIQEILK